MKDNQNAVQYEKDEIELKELIIALWKHRKMIVCITLIFAIIFAMFSMFILQPVYDTKLNIVISMPETYNTKYGEYILPITTNEQYINLITSNDVLVNTINDMEYDFEEVPVESLRNRITIEQIDTIPGIIRNSFVISVSSGNPDDSLKLAQSLFDNYIEFMDVMTKERAVNFLYNDLNVSNSVLENQLVSVKEILQTNIDLLNNTPKTISSGEANIEIQTQLSNTTDYVVPVDSINPNYIKIENDIVENKQSINSIENAIRMNNQYIEELNLEKQALNKYYETGRSEKLDLNLIGIVENSIYLPSPPLASNYKTSPNNILNTVIGVVVGGILGIMVTLVKEYWMVKPK